jgi:hypothetical protein
VDHGVAGAPKWINIAILNGEAMMNIGKTAIFWVLHVRHSEKKTNSILTPEAKGNLTPKYDKYIYIYVYINMTWHEVWHVPP